MRISRLAASLLALLSIALSTPTITAQTAPQVQSFQLVAQKSGWLLASDRLFWTSSLGAQWTDVTPPAATGLAGVFFRPDGTGWVVATSAGGLAIARTQDSGAHWTTASLPVTLTSAQALNGQASTYFADPTHGFLMLGLQSGSAFRPGILLRSVDSGATWTQAAAPPIGGDLTFLDASNGFIAHGPAGDELFRTADAGNTWQRATLPAPSSLATATSTISPPIFSDASHGALLRTFNTEAGPSVVRYETSDAGLTWNSTGAPLSTASVAFTLIRDSAATALVSTSSAVSGLPAATGTLLATRSSFSTATTGWVLFNSGSCASGVCTQTSALRATTDGGRSYVPLASISGIDLEPTVTTPAPSPLSAMHTANPDSTSVYNTSGVMGFDACSLPTTAQLTDWAANSPYRVAGIYIGGANFACSSGLGSLTTAYVSSLLGLGYQMLPIWVGPQGTGACSCTLISTASAAAANAQGVAEADSAVAAMQQIGLGQGSIIDYDMEGYTRGGVNTTATQAFIEGWDTELHNKGYLAAVYSSHGEFDDWYPNVVTPAIDSIWFAYFFSNGVACGTTCQTVFPTPTATFDLSTSYWLNNHRSRQTSSGFNSTYGSTTINIDEDWVDAAWITATPNLLTVSKTGAGASSGTIASTMLTNSNGDATTYTTISCGTVCTGSFAPTDTVTLTATASGSATFGAWTGCTTTSGTTCTVAVTAAKAVSASFTSANTLTVTKVGTGTGTVTSSDSNINCGGTCSYTYATPTTVTLTAAVTSAQTVFGGWTGCTTTSGLTCSVAVSGAANVTATFNGPVALTVARTGSGSGTVTSADALISCGTTCSAAYTYNTSSTLTATAASGSVFTGWSGGGCSGTGTCVVTLTAATTVTANFALPSFTAALSSTTLTVAAGGTVTDILTFTPVNGWSGSFTSFSCTGAPTGVTCAGSPSSVSTTGAAPYTSTITFTVPANVAKLELPVFGRSEIVVAGFLLPALLLPLAFRRRIKGFAMQKLMLALFFCGALGVAQLLTGCSGSSTPAASTTPIFSGSVNVTYVSTQTGGTATNQTVPLTLTITH
jgi:hypothetical protein